MGHDTNLVRDSVPFRHSNPRGPAQRCPQSAGGLIARSGARHAPQGRD